MTATSKVFVKFTLGTLIIGFVALYTGSLIAMTPFEEMAVWQRIIVSICKGVVGTTMGVFVLTPFIWISELREDKKFAAKMDEYTVRLDKLRALQHETRLKFKNATTPNEIDEIHREYLIEIEKI